MIEAAAVSPPAILDPLTSEIAAVSGT